MHSGSLGKTVGGDAPSGGRIARPRLLRALDHAARRRVVLLEAPAGYGKSWLVAEWAAASRARRVAHLSLSRHDGDPAHLLARLSAVAIGPGRRATTVGGLLDALDRAGEPLVLVLDDYHRLAGQPANDTVADVIAHLPAGVQVAIATRATPPLPLARLRAGGDLLELRAADLRLDDDEAVALLAAAGVTIDDPEARAGLLGRLEGWPVGLALAARALRGLPDTAAAATRFAGTHRDVADYIDEEVLQHLRPSLQGFLVLTSALSRLSGPLCDAALGTSGSQAVLEDLERSNAFLVPLDAERRWYRYHRLFAEALRAELCAGPPAVAAELHRRAGAWFDAAGQHADAAEHALAALRLARTPSFSAVALTAAAAPHAPDGASSGRAGGAIAPVIVRPLAFGQRLTEREATILRLLATELSKREIANELFVSVNTVKTHTRAIYRKLGVSSRRDATRRARELGAAGREGRAGALAS
jgi:LuxR family transcriptional regulator, maltose regulon positive regulatory protein